MHCHWPLLESQYIIVPPREPTAFGFRSLAELLEAQTHPGKQSRASVVCQSCHSTARPFSEAHCFCVAAAAPHQPHRSASSKSGGAECQDCRGNFLAGFLPNRTGLPNAVASPEKPKSPGTVDTTPKPCGGLPHVLSPIRHRQPQQRRCHHDQVAADKLPAQSPQLLESTAKRPAGETVGCNHCHVNTLRRPPDGWLQLHCNRSPSQVRRYLQRLAARRRSVACPLLVAHIRCTCTMSSG